MTTISLTILGETCSKANSRRIVVIAGRPASIKSSKALAYEKSALLQIPAHAKQMLDCDVMFSATIYYATRCSDLDESLLMDILQAKFRGSGKNKELIRRGVYCNDRQIKSKRIDWGLDKQNPRAEIEIRTM